MGKLFLFCVLIFFITTNPVSGADDHKIRVVGSSTVYPFAKKVADQFSKMTGYEVPLEESTGSYLVEEGLVPLPKEERKKNYYIARELKPLSIDDL